MAVKHLLLALAVTAGLSACGSRADDPALNAARGVVSGIFNRSADTAALPTIDPRQVFTRELINEAAVPLIFVEIESVGGTAILWQIATNGQNETWQGEDDLTVTLTRDGVLRATRGFAYDLYASDVEDTRAALAARRAGPVSRLMVRVAGDLEEIRTGYHCDIGFASPVSVNIFGQSRRLTPATERCTEASTGTGFENRYWVDSSGFVWASEQWAGTELGHLRIERLYR